MLGGTGDALTRRWFGLSTVSRRPRAFSVIFALAMMGCVLATPLVTKIAGWVGAIDQPESADLTIFEREKTSPGSPMSLTQLQSIKGVVIAIGPSPTT